MEGASGHVHADDFRRAARSQRSDRHVRFTVGGRALEMRPRGQGQAAGSGRGETVPPPPAVPGPRWRPHRVRRGL